MTHIKVYLGKLFMERNDNQSSLALAHYFADSVKFLNLHCCLFTE